MPDSNELNQVAKALSEISWLCTEIGLRTYGRRGDALVQTETWQKLQHAERLVRQISEAASGAQEALNRAKSKSDRPMIAP